MTSLFSNNKTNKTGAQYPKALGIPLNSVLNADFDGILLNFRLTLKFGGPSRLGAQDKLPPFSVALLKTLGASLP